MLLSFSCVKTIAQEDTIKNQKPNSENKKIEIGHAKDSVSLLIKGHIVEANTQESIPFVIVTCASYKTETNLDGNYELKIPTSQIKLMNSDSLSIAFQYPSYCIPTVNIGIDKLIQVVNNKGTLCGIEINGEPTQNQQELLIDK